MNELKRIFVAQSIRLGKKKESGLFRMICIIAFIIINLFIWIYCIILLANPTKYESGIVYDLNSLILAILALVLSIIFLSYGIYLYYVVKRIEEGVSGGSKKKAFNVYIYIFFKINWI